MKLSKQQAKLHHEAAALVDLSRRLTDDECEFVIDNWQESAEHTNSLAGAFFTPRGLARDFAIEVGRGRAIDLCAGIGSLGYAVKDKVDHLVCVEINHDYLKVGRKVLPDAEWIHASIFDPELLKLGEFANAISNPPFGRIKAGINGFDRVGDYEGSEFEYLAIAAAARLARYGVFILPQGSAPFQYSGKPKYTQDEPKKAKAFREATGIIMEMNCGIDTSVYRSEWRGTSPATEIVLCDFAEARSVRALEQAERDARAAKRKAA